jgi:hypothetical protein
MPDEHTERYPPVEDPLADLEDLADAWEDWDRAAAHWPADTLAAAPAPDPRE